MESIFDLIEAIATCIWSNTFGKYAVAVVLVLVIIWIAMNLFESPRKTVERKERELRAAERIAERYPRRQRR